MEGIRHPNSIPKKQLIHLFGFVLSLGGFVLEAQQANPPPVPPQPAIPGARPVRSCESLASVELPDTTIDSVSIDQRKGGPVCRVTATVTHPPAGDRIKVFVALPMQDWNGRFQATGGGGYAGGSPNNITQPADLGYVASS